LAEVAFKWQDPWGDRRQELVFIGHGMDEAAMRMALDAALVPAQDMTPTAWTSLHDPFPEWRRKAA
jgi:Cobalamin synthesis protein cobW C-terminal domain